MVKHIEIFREKELFDLVGKEATLGNFDTPALFGHLYLRPRTASNGLAASTSTIYYNNLESTFGMLDGIA